MAAEHLSVQAKGYYYLELVEILFLVPREAAVEEAVTAEAVAAANPSPLVALYASAFFLPTPSVFCIFFQQANGNTQGESWPFHTCPLQLSSHTRLNCTFGGPTLHSYPEMERLPAP